LLEVSSNEPLFPGNNVLDPEKVPQIQSAFRFFLKEFLNELKIEHGVTTSLPNSNFPSPRKPLLPASDTKLFQSPMPNDAHDILSYVPHPRHTVPPPEEWQHLAAERGWSPKKSNVKAIAKGVFKVFCINH
jgi:hypothetical protein